MDRREVLEKLLIFPLLRPKEQKRVYKLTTIKVAGLQYGECLDEEFKEKESLKLIREPKNPYDKYAVAIYKQNKKVGYIPKTNSRIVASMLDSGENIKVVVRYYKPQEEPWERLWVSLWKIG